MLKSVKWCEYHLYDLFYIYSGNKFDKSKMTMFDPTVNFVGRSSKNNGVTAYVDYVEGVKPYPAGCMTIALGGEYIGSCFIQRHPFYTSQNVFVLSEKEPMEESVKLFISHLIRFESKNNYMAFARELNSHIKTDFVIKLPSIEEGVLDIAFINSYIDSFKIDIESIPDYFLNEGYDKACWYIDTIDVKQFESEYSAESDKKHYELNTCKWKYFEIGKLFDVQLSKGDIKLSSIEQGDIPLISSGSINNGIVGFIDKNGDGLAKMFQKNTITLDMFCNAFYQDADYYSVSHGRVNILVPFFKLNKKIGLFITTIINMEKDKYSYGRGVYSGIASKMKIKLPVICDNNGFPIIDNSSIFSDEGYVPNWGFMEDYINSLPFSNNI